MLIRCHVTGTPFRAEYRMCTRHGHEVWLHHEGLTVSRGPCPALDAALTRIWTLDPDEPVLELQASAGQYTGLDGP
jgi:hypothetical protein